MRSPDKKTALALRSLFPGGLLVQRLQRPLRRGQTSTEDIVAGRNVPHEIALIVELLQACPREKWPDRWREAAGLKSNRDLIFSKFSGGQTAREIADDLGLTRQRVHDVLGPLSSLSPHHRDAAISTDKAARTWCIGAAAALNDIGIPDSEIVDAVGDECTGSKLSNARRQGLIPPRRTRTLVTEEMKAEIDRLWADGTPKSSIAALVGVKSNVVYRHLRDHRK